MAEVIQQHCDNLEKKSKKACVIGGSGYVGSQLVKLLLVKGYSVNTTVRDPGNANKISHLIPLQDLGDLKIFDANLTDEGSFDAAVEGCGVVFLVATPVNFASEDPEEASYKERLDKLKEEFIHAVSKEPKVSSKADLVETVTKLGLSNVLQKEIKDALDCIVSKLNNNDAGFEDDLLSTALSFRLLRQHGYNNASQDIFVDFMSEMDLNHKEGPISKLDDLRGILELFEASHLAVDGEETMVKAKAFSLECLLRNMDMDVNLAKKIGCASEIPCHRRVLWFDVRHQIRAYELEDNKDLVLLEMAKLNFNIVQAMHLDNLKEMSRWWKKLGLIENVGFTRDRLVESFLWAVGVAYEPQHALLRKCLTKVVTFVLVLDDLYDIYGSLEELECFTRTVERWDYQEVDLLPECMKICFKTLVTTTYEIASDIHKEKGSNDTLPFLKIAWADFCKALLMEAWWYKKRYIPTLKNYLQSAWVTSSGPLLSLIALLCTTEGKSKDLKSNLEQSHDLIYNTSLIIRLLNDQATSEEELKRGDAHSSTMCYMAEANVTEEVAREHMKEMIGGAWRKINLELINANAKHKSFVHRVINMARVCHFIYHKGDGFGVQDGDTKKTIKHLLIQPFQLS